MIRNRKRGLGLALLAVFTISAVGASGSLAAEFHSEASSTVLTGEQDPGTVDVYSTTAGAFECGIITYVGFRSGTTSTTVSAEPLYAGCTAFGFASSTVNTNGCEYVFHTSGTFDITGCNSSSGVIISTSLFGTQKCKLTVLEQDGINNVTFTNVGTGTTREITIHVAATNIKYTEHAGTGFGACASSSEQVNGTYNGTTIFTGEDEAGNHHGIWYA